MILKIYTFFDKLEDRVRKTLSKVPIIYAFFGGVGVVIFWRGVWHTADFLMEFFFLNAAFQPESSLSASQGLPWWDGPLSLFVGTCLLLITGVFVSNFIGNEIIISGVRGEKKLAEKNISEIQTEAKQLGEIKIRLEEIEKKLEIILKK